MHESFICFSHSCPSRGKELEKEGTSGESLESGYSPSPCFPLAFVLPESSSWSASCSADGSAADTQLGWFNPQSVCVCVWQPRQGAGKLFSLGAASVVSPKVVGWTAVLFLEPLCHEVKFGWRTDVLSRKESWFFFQRMFSHCLCQQMKLLSNVLFM